MPTLQEVTKHVPFELAPLQAQDIQTLAQYSRVGLFWDVGVGKTLAASMLCLLWGTQHNLIIMPHILLQDWKAWINTIDPGASVEIYYGPKRQESALHAKWVLTSHAIFRDSYSTIFRVFSGRDTTLVVDEAHALKNVQSVLFKRVASLSTGVHLCLMTGTPTNKPDDSYSYIRLKTPNVYRSKGHFENLHVAKRDFFDNVTEWHDLEGISRALYLQATKRSKDEVFGARPKPIYQPMRYALDPKHQKLYAKLAEEQLLSLPDGGVIDASTAQRMYHNLQQIVVNYDFFAGDPAVRSQSFQLLDNVIDNVRPMEDGCSKLIVWTWYRRSSAAITAYLQKSYGPEAVVAAYSGVNSAASIQAFQYDPNVRFLVGQPGSCGVGFNPQKVCWEQLFMETPTVPLYVRQAVGRVDRMGQEHVPTIRFGMALGTIQEYLAERLVQNDDLVTVVEALPQSLRSAIFGGH